jgi:hypothetical protein
MYLGKLTWHIFLEADRMAIQMKREQSKIRTKDSGKSKTIPLIRFRHNTVLELKEKQDEEEMYELKKKILMLAESNLYDDDYDNTDLIKFK